MVFIPVIFLLVSSIIHFSWFWTLDLWKEEEVPNPLIRYRNGEVISNKTRDKLLSNIIYWRRWLFILAIIASGVFHVFDTADLWKEYTSKSFEKQLENACVDRDFFSKWIFEKYIAEHGSKDPCHDESLGYTKSKVESLQISVKPIDKNRLLITIDSYEKDDSQNTKSNENKIRGNKGKSKTVAAVSAPWKQKVITLTCYFQQFMIITMGFLILFQICAQILFFLLPPFLETAKDEQLVIWVHHESPGSDFGLHSWDHALDRIFWLIALGMVVPIISRISQPDLDKLDCGQLMAQWLLGLLVIGPLLLTLFVRQKWIHACRKRALVSGIGAIESFENQRVWPLTKKITDKLGILASFLMWGYLIGVDIIRVLEFLMSK